MYSLVNDLDLSIDVIRYSVPINNVTAPKYFKNVVMKDLKATSTVQEVNIADWFTKATFIEGNYTIQGTTVIENPIFYNNVKYLLNERVFKYKYENFVIFVGFSDS